MFGLDVWPNSVLRVRVTARRFLELKHLRLVQRDCKAKTESTTSAIIVEIASLAPNIFFFKVVTCYFWLLLATGSHSRT